MPRRSLSLRLLDCISGSRGVTYARTFARALALSRSASSSSARTGDGNSGYGLKSHDLR